MVLASLDLHQDGKSVVTVVRDITKRKRTEFELHNVNRALRAMSEVNTVVVHAQDELKLLSDVCQVLVDSCGYRLAWVGFAEHDKDKTVRPVAQWCFEEGYLRTVDITWSDTERGLGPTGTAIRTGIPITVTNIQKDPKYAPWNAEATERGYACAIALPLLEDGHPFGALNIYAKEFDAFNQEEVNLLMELASSLAYGIRSVRAHVEREQAAETAMLYLDLMGHDIRNHLQAIVMGAEILTSADLDANQSSVIDLITESVERSRSLIHKVQKTQELLSIPLSEKPLISALENSLEVLKQTHEDIEIEVDYKIRRATIRADRYLETLMMNLLENAVIHNNKDPRKLWVTLSKAEEGYEISIADNGPGISDEKKLALFDPKRRFGGVGVHQALRIVQKYDGRISVHDRVVGDFSQGAELRLWLPKSDTSNR